MAHVRTATLRTDQGDIVVDLFPFHAPRTVANFVELAEGTREWVDPESGEKVARPLYDGTVFHRVIDGFMIQGGDPLGDGTGGPGYAFADEFHPELAFTKPFLLAMANAARAPTARSSSSRSRLATRLTRKHTIFGEVTDPAAREVVKRIAAVATDGDDRPLRPVVIESVEITRR
ncbi:peptidylprolyl isomerase [Kitasatospora arboriphila]